MKAAQMKTILGKVMTAGVVAGALAMLPAAKAQAQSWGVGVQFGAPVYGYAAPVYGPDDYARQRYYEHERREAWERQQAWLRQQEWMRHERHEAWERERSYRDRDHYRDYGYDRR